jgi:hypothetical protein
MHRIRLLLPKVRSEAHIKHLQILMCFHKGSLVKTTLTKLHRKHPDQGFKKKHLFERFKTYLLSSRSWGFYLLFSVLFCFGIPIINIPLINVIKPNSSFFEYLTKNRVTHAIALLSILFTIVGIALSNLARKNFFDEYNYD